ncbi:hypothetical protein Esi_0105_0025 [Ectocarpus siliculosus]|uniref:Thioredoxin domain-containing protein n=1 Tax=Ectocarpus siliculosus TaxID=2880 RepID=D7FH47_ECTSI|nr:hypothetical protein Esi_0105_0025 [Ectocarpus siliculosus]|eukprot:CBJ28422.1 hypothetical protein Esi_0105_0025 [Ectocarpus siliculosus]
MMATQSTTAFALGVLALAPGGANIDSRTGGGGSSSSRGVGLVDAFVGQPTTIRAGDGGSAEFSARRSGLHRCVGPPCEKLGGASGSSSRSGRDGVKPRVTRTTGFGNSAEDFKYVADIKGGVVGFLEAMDQSLSGELLRHRLRVLAEAHALAGSGAMFYEIDLNANPEVHKMLDIHATPTVLLYCSGQLVDEFTCAGDSGPRVMLKHIEEQVGSIPDPWHRIRSGPSPESPTPGTTSSVSATEDDA